MSGLSWVVRDEPTSSFGEHDALWGSFGDDFFFPYNMLVTGPGLSVLTSLMKFHTAVTCCWLHRVHLNFGIPPL